MMDAIRQDLGAEVVPTEYGGQAESVPIELAVRRLPSWQQQQQQHERRQQELRRQKQQLQHSEAAVGGQLGLPGEQRHDAASLQAPAVAVLS